MSFFFYSGAMVEIINSGLSGKKKKNKKHLGGADYTEVLISGTAALLCISQS